MACLVERKGVRVAFTGTRRHGQSTAQEQLGRLLRLHHKAELHNWHAWTPRLQAKISRVTAKEQTAHIAVDHVGLLDDTMTYTDMKSTGFVVIRIENPRLLRPEDYAFRAQFSREQLFQMDPYDVLMLNDGTPEQLGQKVYGYLQGEQKLKQAAETPKAEA